MKHENYDTDNGPVLKQISEMMDRVLGERLKTWGLTPSQGRVLILLDSAGGGMTQKDIEDTLMVSHPTVVGIVKRLIIKGMVSQEGRDGNSSVAISLTETGDAVVGGVIDTLTAFEEHLVRGMSSDDSELFAKLLRGARDNLASMCEREARQ